jgi:hypothetical protein
MRVELKGFGGRFDLSAEARSREGGRMGRVLLRVTRYLNAESLVASARAFQSSE